MPGPVVTQLDGGIVRVTLALPWALDHVHCYALPGPTGWTLVDSGLGDSGTLAAWAELLPGLSPVERLVITHYHPDHLGAGAGLVRMTGASEVVQGELDARLAAAAWGGADSPDEFRRHLELHGMPSQLAARSTDAEQRLPIHPPTPTRLVNAGDELELAGERWVVHLLPGHADGHIALHGQRSGRLLGGDVLLAEITPNIGRWPDTAPDPLGAYLRSLDASQLENLLGAARPANDREGKGERKAGRELMRGHRERVVIVGDGSRDDDIKPGGEKAAENKRVADVDAADPAGALEGQNPDQGHAQADDRAPGEPLREEGFADEGDDEERLGCAEDRRVGRRGEEEFR